ncbi:MAG: hypothetical protein ACODAC_08335 [Pseudomonadota bacterium]
MNVRWSLGIALLLWLPLVHAAPGNAPVGDDDDDAVRVLPSPLAETVRDATAAYRDVETAMADGYELFLGCVSGRQVGAMGIHYVRADLLEDGAVDPRRPESLVYEPQQDGSLELVGVEYITFAEVWDGMNEAAPVLAGQVFHYTGEPNRYRIPAHYELHVWAWRRNPLGTFADFNPRVSCEPYDPRS